VGDGQKPSERVAEERCAMSTGNADRAKKWARLGIKLGVVGAFIGAITGAIAGFYERRGKHEADYVEGTTVRLISPGSDRPEDVPASEAEERLRSTVGYCKVADPEAMVSISAPDGTLGEVPAKNLAAALRAGGRLVSDKRQVSVEVQRKLDLEKDFDAAKMGALFYAVGVGGLGLFAGLVPAAWFLFLVMLGQVASAVRKD
jgi:hypothetical protein